METTCFLLKQPKIIEKLLYDFFIPISEPFQIIEVASLMIVIM